MANTLRFKRGLLAGLPSAAVGEPLFTTDTFDLYIGTASGTQKYQKFIASGTTSQLLRGDGSLLTMPIVLTSPANGEVLKYNGTNWVNSSDAGITGSGVAGQVAYFTGATTQGGSNNLFWDNSNGRLGIGTTSPAVLLHLQSSLTGTTTFSNVLQTFRTGAAGRDILLQFSDGTNQAYIGSLSGNLYFGTNGTNERARITAGGNFIINNASTDNGLRFQVTGDGYFSGSVGIGSTPNASYQATISSNTDYKGLLVTGSGHQLLLIESTTSARQALLSLKNGGRQYSLSLNTDNTFSIYDNTAAATRLTLDTSGNLGLGVVPSVWGSGFRAMQIGLGTSLYNNTNGNGTFLGSNFFYNGTNNIYLNNGTATAYGQSLGQHQWFIAPSGTAGNAVSFTQAMTLDASGNLGIATSSPLYKLQVYNSGNGTTAAFGGTARGLRIDNDGTFSSGRTSIFGVDNTFYASFQPLSIEASSLTLQSLSGGNVLVGTTTDAGYKLDVNGTMRVSGASTLNARTVINSDQAYGLEVYRSAAADSRLNLTNSTTGTGGDKGTMVAAIGTTAYLYNFQNGSLILGTNGTDRLTISSTGAATFSSSVTATAFIPSYNTVNYITDGAISNYSAINYLYVNGNAGGGLFLKGEGTGKNNIRIESSTLNLISFQTNSSERMRVTSNGNLLIGTTTDATYKLDVNGTMRVSGASTIAGTSNGNILLVTGPNTGSNTIHITVPSGTSEGLKLTYNANDGSSDINNVFNAPLYFKTNNTTRLTIASTGAATFSSTVSATSYSSAGLELMTSDGTSNYIKTGATLFFQSGATTLMSLTTGGNLAVDTNTLFVDAANNRVGVKQSSPTSSLHVDGSNARSYVTKTANYTMTENDYTVLCDTTSGGFTITLPAASGCAGRIYCIKKTVGNSGVNNVTIDGNASETIDGSTTISLQCRSSVIIQSDGSNWWVLAEKNDASCI